MSGKKSNFQQFYLINKCQELLHNNITLLKNVHLAKQNGFGLTFLYILLPLVKDTEMPNTCCWLAG